jgi:hypothetical protein
LDSRNKQRPKAIALEKRRYKQGDRKMPCKATTALIALLVFGFPSVVLADTNNRAGHHHLFVQRPVATMSNGHIRAVSDAARPFTAKEGGSFAASPPGPSTLFCRGGSSGRTKPWIKLTGPGGEPVHINVEQITSVKSDTEISGARTQLDLASGKFQRVKENVEQVMQLISAISDARENEETPSAGLICVGSIDRPLPPRAGL